MAERGGKRVGAGRKPGAKTVLTKDISAEILASAGPTAIWNRLLNSGDEKIVLECMKYLTDRVWGKAKQSVDSTISNPDGSKITSMVVQFIAPNVQ